MEFEDFTGKMSFTFICPRGREEEVIELFNEKNLGLLNPDYFEDTRSWVDPDRGKVTEIKGFNFSGVTHVDKMADIIKELANKKIASFSRATQVFFKPMTEPETIH